jgi:hypothetical protein
MVTHAHAAKADSRNFQVAVSKFALLHFSKTPMPRLAPVINQTFFLLMTSS